MRTPKIRWPKWAPKSRISAVMRCVALAATTPLSIGQSLCLNVRYTDILSQELRSTSGSLVVYVVDDPDQVVTVLKIGHRPHVYR